MKKIVSIVLTVIILFTTVILSVDATNITEEDTVYYESNIQRLKDYIVENGKKLDNYLYLESEQTDNKTSKTALIKYYPNTDEIEFGYIHFVLIPNVKDIATISLQFISLEEPTCFRYSELMDVYLTTAHSDSFNWFDFDIYHVPGIYFELLDNRPAYNSSQEQKKVVAEQFFKMQSDAIERWDKMLKELFGFKYEGIGLGASFDKHHLSRTGCCVLCGRRFFDTSKCTCSCHKDGFFYETITIIKALFWKLFRINQTCDCGMKHY